MGGFLSIPIKTSSVAHSISNHKKYIFDKYYLNQSAEILYDKDSPQYLVLKDEGSNHYTWCSSEIENIHTVVETKDIIVETHDQVIIISASVNILSKPVRQSSECGYIFYEVKGYTTTFSKKI